MGQKLAAIGELNSFWLCIHLLTLLTILDIEANSVDPYQTAPTGAVRSWSTLFVEEASDTFQQMTKQAICVAIGALWVKTLLFWLSE